MKKMWRIVVKIVRMIFRRELLDELYRIDKTFLLNSIVGFLIGMGYGFEVNVYFIRYGLGSLTGAVAMGVSWELMPLITALIAVGRIGVAYAAELASMKVGQQIDALKTLAVTPWQYLVFPKFIACLIMMPGLTIFAVFACFFGEYLVAQSMGVNMETFLNLAKSAFNFSYLIKGMLKAIVFGGVIALISCSCGLNLEKEQESAWGVGRAVEKTVIFSFVAIFLINFCFAFSF